MSLQNRVSGGARDVPPTCRHHSPCPITWAGKTATGAHFRLGRMYAPSARLSMFAPVHLCVARPLGTSPGKGKTC
ncbi:hypothetical protein PY32053_03399 [Paracoccus yeei]|uniref:Uncharacterized protein n=1 Tax=Paracoccus yeei TaxID=147645 RepID=A0A386URD5_9RHOB|nr:hypothetical protein PY32053_03399 [Paracoccus yeei]